MYIYIYIYIHHMCICVCVCVYMSMYMYVGHGQNLVSSSWSSIFGKCIIVFQVLGMHMCTSYICHGIRIGFQHRMKYFLTLSNAAQSCETLGHSFFFMELTPPLAQPPLSHH